MAEVHRLYPLSEAQEELDSAQVQLNSLARALAQEALRRGSGGGNSGGMATDIDKRVSTLEGDHRALLIAFGAAFVILITALGGGYLALSNQISSGFDRAGTKFDVISSDIAQTKTDIAVLEERSKK